MKIMNLRKKVALNRTKSIVTYYFMIEILEYARYLGMNLPEDRELLWIAREGLKAPLPKDWKPIKTRDGDVYYYNFATKQSLWEHPCDEHYKKVYQQKKKEIAMKNRGNKASKARGRLADALSMNGSGTSATSQGKGSNVEDRLNALASSTLQSQLFASSQAYQKTELKDEANDSFSQNGSFDSSSTSNKKINAADMGPLLDKNARLGQLLQDDGDYGDDSFEHDYAKLGISSLTGGKSKNSEFPEVDEEIDRKIQAAKEEQQRETAQLELKVKREQQFKRDEYESEMGKSLAALTLKMSTGYLASQKKLTEELAAAKKKIEQELEKAYKEKEKIRKEESEELMKKNEIEELKKIENEVEAHSKRVREEFEIKKNVD